MAQIGDVLYLKSGSQPMTVVRQEEGDSAMVQLMSSPGVIIEIPLAALTETDPRPAVNATFTKATSDALVAVGIETVQAQLAP